MSETRVISGELEIIITERNLLKAPIRTWDRRIEIVMEIRNYKTMRRWVQSSIFDSRDCLHEVAANEIEQTMRGRMWAEFGRWFEQDKLN